MMARAGVRAALAGGLWLAAASLAQPPGPASAPDGGPLHDLLACREIAAGPARLACFDRTSAGLVSAAARRDVIVMDRGEVRRTRRSLFGLTLPRLGFLGGGGDEDRSGAPEAKRPAPPRDDVDTLETTLVSAGDAANGYLQLALQEGGTWRTTDPWVGSVPAPGAKVTIRRGALGNFTLHVGNSRAFRAMRLR